MATAAARRVSAGRAGRALARLRASRRWRDRALVAPAVAVLALLFGGAVAGMLKTSLIPLGADGLSGATLDTWRALLGDPAFVDALLFSLRVTVLATVASAALAVPIALALRRRGLAIRSLAALPLPVPHLLVAVAAVLWLGPGGLADRLLGGLPLTLVRDDAGVGIVLVYVFRETPFLVLLMLAAMGRGLQERTEAAAVLGASPGQRARWVLWPTIRGPLVVGSIIVAAFVLGAFEVPLAVGPSYPPTLATFAFDATQGNVLAGEGLAAATLLLTSTVAVALAVAAVRFARDVEGS
jgi:putative spermidine/putrescine transport system permease protein